MRTRVDVHEIVSRVRALDGRRGLSEETIRHLVEAVLQTIEDRDLQERRLARDLDTRGHGGGNRGGRS